jgi:CheY-like chemotaxis protein
VKQYLETWGMKPDAAENGLQAIAKIREAAQSRQPYGLAVLDCGMPEVSGIDVARIVASDRKVSDTPLIMLTSYDDRNEVKAAKDVGILAFLTKPVRKQSLFKAILKALAPKPLATLPPEDAVRKPQTEPRLKHGTRLLLVEDNEDNQKLAIRLLEKHGFICDIAANGLEAMRSLAQQSYPLVLMDCQMPLMDGFETSIAIRKLEQELKRRTPIVAMTAHALPEDRQKCLAAGMDDYLSKPINERHLIKAIQRWLLPTHAAPAPAATPPPAERIHVPAKAGLEDLIPGYLANRRHDLLSLAEAVNRGDLRAARSIGHGMKGSGTGYGFPAISEIGRSIEQCAATEDADGILHQVSSLEEFLSRVEVDY